MYAAPGRSSIKIAEPSAEPENHDLRNRLEKPFSSEEIALLGKILDSFDMGR